VLTPIDASGSESRIILAPGRVLKRREDVVALSGHTLSGTGIRMEAIPLRTRTGSPLEQATPVRIRFTVTTSHYQIN
jgi:hypothetical protein